MRQELDKKRIMGLTPSCAIEGEEKFKKEQRISKQEDFDVNDLDRGFTGGYRGM